MLFAPLLSLSASEILQALEVSMTSVGRTMPVKVYSDSALSFILLNESRQGVETSQMNDEEYLDLQRKITEQGIKLVNHCAYAPHKTGKVERKVASLKVLLRAHYSHLSDLNYQEFTYLLKKSQFLVNSRPIGCYTSTMNTYTLSPNDILFPAQSGMYISDIEEFSPERGLWEGFNRTNRLYRAFKQMFISLYIEAARKHNKKTSKRLLVPEDIVIILDRLTRGSDMAIAQVVSIDK